MAQIFGVLIIALATAVTAAVWWFGYGFYFDLSASWAWVWRFTRAYGHVPWFLVWVPLAALAGSATAILGVVAAFTRVGARTLHGEHDMETAHGSAHWATVREIKDAGIWRETGVVVGGVKIRGRVKALRDEGPEHVLIFAPPRSGKGAGLLIPTLLTWEASTVVMDLRGENYGKTAGWRSQQGHVVLRFDPAAPKGSIRWNPLAEVRVGTDHEIADAQNIAMMIIDPDGKGLVDFWMKSGFAWLSAAIIHTLYRVRANDDRTATLADVDTLLSAVDAGGLEAQLAAMVAFDHGRADVNDMVRAGTQEMRDRAAQERSGVHSSAKIDLSLYRDPIIRRNTSASDFRLTDLQNGEKPVSLYLVVPPSDIDRLRPLLRIFWNLLLRRLMPSFEYAGVASHKRQLLLMFDEFTSVKKLEIFETSLAYMGGFGIKAFLIIQNLPQLEEVYGRNNPILALCKVKGAFAPNDVPTAEIISKMCGTTTIVSKKHERNRGMFQVLGGSVNDRLEAYGRPLLTPDEVMRLLPAARSKSDPTKVVAPGEMLTFVTGHAPVRGRQKLYHLDADLDARSRIPAPGSTLVYEAAPEPDAEAAPSRAVNDLTARIRAAAGGE